MLVSIVTLKVLLGLFTAATNVSATALVSGSSEVVEFELNTMSKSASTASALVDRLLRQETKRVLIIIFPKCKLIHTCNFYMKLSTQWVSNPEFKQYQESNKCLFT